MLAIPSPTYTRRPPWWRRSRRRAGIGWADSVATLLLVGLIGRAAWGVFRDNVPVLMDAARVDPTGMAELASPWPGAGPYIASDPAA